MIGFAAPAFAVAGALLSLVPLALHMLARTPPDRRPLPTARFLSPDRRTRLRPRRPSDLLLLALRMLLLLLLGAAFAGPYWAPDRSGSATVVVLDAGTGMSGHWQAALDSARARVAALDAMLLTFDTVATLSADPEATLDSLSLASPSAPSSWLAALRGLHGLAPALQADSAAAVLVTRARWGAWSPAIPVVREAAWPGRLALVEAGPPAPEPTAASVAAQDSAQLPAPASSRNNAAPFPDASLSYAIAGGDPEAGGLAAFVRAAMDALGHAPTDSAPDLLLRLPGARSTVEAPLEVVLGDPAPAGVWDASPAGAPRTGSAAAGERRLVLPDGRLLPGWKAVPGRPDPGARVVVAWEDGRPAGAAGGSAPCVAYLAAEPEDGALSGVTHPGFPHLLAMLIDACRGEREPPAGGTSAAADAPGGDAPLDAGAREALAGRDLPVRAALADLGGRERLELGRWLLALALVVACTEAGITYLRRNRP